MSGENLWDAPMVRMTYTDRPTPLYHPGSDLWTGYLVDGTIGEIGGEMEAAPFGGGVG